MKNILFALSACLFFSFSGNKIAVKTSPIKIQKSEEKIETPEHLASVERNINLPKTNAPIEKRDQQKTSIIIVEPKKNFGAFNHQTWNGLLKKHVSASGQVNYQGFKKDRSSLRIYLNELSKNIPKESWTKSDKLAYWLNAYNAFTVKLIIDNYPLKSIKDIKDPWNHRFIKLGVKWYTLNDIEHRILRKMQDPRIHFGINCASISCPPLLNKSFTAQNVDQELEKLTVSFINNAKHNSISKNTIKLSKIFQWFSKDFKTKGSIIQFLNIYSKVTINQNAKKSYTDYNWNLNEY